jgi:hypothetical protein
MTQSIKQKVPFHPEDGGKTFLRNVDNFLLDFTVSHLSEDLLFIIIVVITSNSTKYDLFQEEKFSTM